MITFIYRLVNLYISLVTFKADMKLRPGKANEMNRVKSVLLQDFLSESFKDASNE